MFALVATGRTGELRTWTSKTGTYSAEAEMVELKGDGNVSLKRKDGRVIDVPLDRLSTADQEYVRQQSGLKDAAGGGAASAGPAKTPEQIESEALDCHTAKEAVLIYKFYLAQSNLTALQRAAAETQLKVWEQKVKDDQVRLGKTWMKKSEADKLRKQADAKIEHGMEMLRLGNGELAQKSLQEASQLDPDSIQADFLMGVVWGAIVDNDRKAQQCFQRCLKREPDNVSVQNNLAISLMAQKKYGAAAELWKAAAASAPKMPALSQNIGSLITLAGVGRYRVPKRTHGGAQRGLRRSDHQARQPAPDQNWLCLHAAVRLQLGSG